jgi:hypothetical protein
MKIKLAEIEFKESEINSALIEGKTFLAKGLKLYAILETRNGVIARECYKEHGSLPLTPKGRFILLTPKEANRLVKFKLCLETV